MLCCICEKIGLEQTSLLDPFFCITYYCIYLFVYTELCEQLWHKSTEVCVNVCMYVCLFVCMQREITRKLTFPKQPTNPFLEMVKFLLERIAPVHIDSEAIRCVCVFFYFTNSR